jgi:hypothetical protein
MKMPPVPTVDDVNAPPTDREIPHARQHRARWLVAGTVLVVLIVGGVWFAIQWLGRGPEEASVSDAVDRFRTSPTDPSPSGMLAPAAGVYTYVGQGEEHLSFLSTSQPEGPTLPGTITHGDAGCWTFEIEYNSFHRQSWEWCEQDGRLVERGGTTYQQFDFGAFKVDDTSRVLCDPPFVAFDPGARPGDTAAVDCRGDSETIGTELSSQGTARFVGHESVDVAARTVPALHYRMRREISGDQTGEERTDMWFSADNGMPLRNAREIIVVSPAPAPLNSVTYTERGEWQLATLTPQT